VGVIGRQPLETLVKRVIKRRLLAGRFRSESTGFAPVAGGEARVLICLWNRSSRITDILELLDSQDFAPGIRLYLWNNNKSEHEVYRRAIAEFTAKGALKTVDLVKTPYNLGSIARFYWARKLSADGEPIIVIDDDQDIAPTFVSKAIAAYRPDTISAWWAWTVGDSYWERQKAKPGEHVDHIGPGGMICSSRIFADKTFFTTIPEKYWMLDDIWLSYFATRHGYTLAKLDVDIDFVMDETNQFYSQASLKPDFYASLRA
jgi:hypothetical protein